MGINASRPRRLRRQTSHARKPWEKETRGKGSGADVGSAYDVPTLSPKPKSPMARVRPEAGTFTVPARGKLGPSQNAPRGLDTLDKDTLAHHKGEGHASQRPSTNKTRGSTPHGLTPRSSPSVSSVVPLVVGCTTGVSTPRGSGSPRPSEVEPVVVGFMNGVGTIVNRAN